jgi:predicted amino acid-binding ACT domain protein
MKTWEFAKTKGSKVKISERLADAMGLVHGGFVYSTLFGYSDNGPKEYELILSMYPQENYRTLTNLTIYMQDVPGATAQAANFLGSRDVNILNSISLNAISDTVIIWKMLVDLSFSGEADILKEKFKQLRNEGDPSVSKLNLLETRPADIGRVFRTVGGKNKTEVRRGAPTALDKDVFDLDKEYGDLLGRFGDSLVLISADPATWIISISFFRKDARLVRMGFEIPDCPGSIGQVVGSMAEKNVNLISVFSKVKICYQIMTLEIVADITHSGLSAAGLKKEILNDLGGMNGVFELTEYTELG